MRRAALAAVVMAAAIGSVSTGASAALCGGGSAGTGFNDVQDTDVFCNSTQWMKNRAITLGCGAGTNYCPNDVVTRASMALFMNRLGNALTPKLVGRQTGTDATNMAPSLFTPFCFGAALPAVNYPQTARARGTIAIPMTGPAVEMFLVMTLNGQPYQNMNSTAHRLTSPSGTVRLSWSSNAVDVPPGVTVGFAIGLSNPAGSVGTLNLGAGICALEAEVVNRVTTSAPFDEEQ